MYSVIIPVYLNQESLPELVDQLNEIVKEADCQDVEPIALTDDILRKCGFRNFLREQWILKIGKTHFDWEFEDNTLRLRNPSPCLSPITSLHQLQNFLFAIANYELDVVV